jgi:hypothetical protein
MRRVPAALFLPLVLLLPACTEQVAEPDFEVPVAFNSGLAGHHYGTPLSGREEVPANDQPGRGVAQFWLSEDGTELRYKLIVANVENVTQSHIHIGAFGTNGPVVVFLFGFVPGGVTVNGPLAEGTITQADLIARPAIGFGATMAELLAAIESGNAYVNVHTVAIPGGEIRGQL